MKRFNWEGFAIIVLGLAVIGPMLIVAWKAALYGG